MQQPLILQIQDQRPDNLSSNGPQQTSSQTIDDAAVADESDAIAAVTDIADSTRVVMNSNAVANIADSARVIMDHLFSNISQETSGSATSIMPDSFNRKVTSLLASVGKTDDKDAGFDTLPQNWELNIN